MSELALQSGPLRGPLRKRESSLWAREPNDWYVEPEWCSRRLFEQEKFEGAICDPACGGGNILNAAKAAGYQSFGFDKVKRSDWCVWEKDFLAPEWAESTWQPENIVSNPPFRLCDPKDGRPGFVELALRRAQRKVALLMPANWVQGAKRSRWLAETPLLRVLYIAPRPSMPPGQVLASGVKAGAGTTDYAWFIWLRGYDARPEIGWLRRDA